MADDTYGQLLDAIGFPAAEAASAEERTKRKLGLATADVNLQTAESAKGIDNDFEDRGMFVSGARNVERVTNEAKGANKIGQLAIGAAEDIAAGQAEIAKAQAQRAVQDQQLSMQTQEFEQQMAAAREQAALDAQLKQAQLAFAREQMLAGSAGGFDLAALNELVRRRTGG